MPIPKLTGQISMSNYYALNGNNENLTMIQAGIKPSKKLNVTIGLGNDNNIDSQGSSVNKPALEIKAKYNIGKYFNTQARFREIGGKEQYRVTFGGSYPLDKNNSIYSALHATTNDFEKGKVGGWLGYTHNTKSGISISAEFQQNFGINNKTAQNPLKTLGSFNDGNKSVNLIVSVPFK